jgi:transposase InsO family protein
VRFPAAHIDVSYINVSGTFYYLCSILDGYSRSIVHWDLRESMTEAEIEVILQRAREKYPEAKPRIISDNGPQFIARDFKGVHSHRRNDSWTFWISSQINIMLILKIVKLRIVA